MEIKDESRRFLSDEGRAMENLLLKTAIEKKVIDEKVLELVKSEK
jgi:hypothetical protein